MAQSSQDDLINNTVVSGDEFIEALTFVIEKWVWLVAIAIGAAAIGYFSTAPIGVSRANYVLEVPAQIPTSWVSRLHEAAHEAEAGSATVTSAGRNIHIDAVSQMLSEADANVSAVRSAVYAAADALISDRAAALSKRSTTLGDILNDYDPGRTFGQEGYGSLIIAANALEASENDLAAATLWLMSQRDRAITRSDGAQSPVARAAFIGTAALVLAVLFLLALSIFRTTLQQDPANTERANRVRRAFFLGRR